MAELSFDDTIAAISTPLGQGGIGIVRLSGPEAITIAQKMFQPKGKKNVPALKSFTVHYGWIVRRLPSGEIQPLDEALLTIMRAPKSYTKEDVVEFSCHGGVVALNAILRLAIDFGARLAEPGEFTKRAFLNGRIDLTQAEAVLDVIQSKTDRFLQVSLNQLKGELTRTLESIREQLMNIYVELEGVVNFPEDEVDAEDQKAMADNLRDILKKVKQLLDSSEQGRILREGIKIVLCGKPNVGKSSLLNILVQQPRAIVSKIAGTTRDTIEETVQIKGIPFQVVDTAGILKPRNAIEEEAVRRSHMNIANADLVLLLIDASVAFTDEDRVFFEEVKEHRPLIVVNKCDLPRRVRAEDLRAIFGNLEMMDISAKTKEGIEFLKEKIIERVLKGETFSVDTLLITNARHVQALKRGEEFILQAIKSLGASYPPEFISEDIKSAIASLDQITGRSIDADLLNDIFSRFCIGK